MDKIVTYIIISGVISLTGWIVWVVFVLKGANKTAMQAEQDLNLMLSQMEGMMQYKPEKDKQIMSLKQQTDITNMFIKAQMQINQIDNPTRSNYESRIENLQGIAASAGIDWGLVKQAEYVNEMQFAGNEIYDEQDTSSKN